MNYYNRHLGDYARFKGHLLPLEHGMMTLLTDRYYTTEEGIPDAQVYRVCHATSADERAAVDTVLAEFFVLRDGIWVSDEIEAQIAAARTRINAARRNGQKGGRPRKPTGDVGGSQNITQEKPTGLPVGTPDVTQPKPHQSPITKHHDPECMQQHAAAARVIKFRRTRSSGLVTWVPDDVREAERLEREKDEGAIRDACAAIKRNGKEPVPGRVSRYIDQQARAKQAADRQAAIDQRLVARPPIDEERARKGLRFLPQRLRQHAVSAGVAEVAGDDGEVEEGAT